MIRQFFLLGNTLQCIVIADGALNVLGHHHRFSFSFQFMVAIDLGIKVVQHHFSLSSYRLWFSFHQSTQESLCLCIVVLRILLYTLTQFIIALVSGVVCQHIQDKALFYRLLHAIQVIGIILTVSMFGSKSLQSLFFRCGRKCEV